MEEKERLEVIKKAQKNIRFCPHCGYESDKPFDGVDVSGGDWDCESCKEKVEAYILKDTEEEELEDGQESNGKVVGLIDNILAMIIPRVILGAFLGFYLLIR